MELLGSRLLTVRLCCGRQDLAVLPLNCTSLPHFLSSVCCVLFSFSAALLDSSRIIGIFENLVCAAAGLLLGQRAELYRGHIHCSTSGGKEWGFMFCKVVLKIEHVSTTFQRNAAKTWRAGPSVAADVIKSLLCWVACTMYLISSS